MLLTVNMPARVTSYTATAKYNINTNSIFDNDFKGAIIKTDLPDYFPTIFIIKLKTAFSRNNHADQPYRNVILTKTH